MTSQKSESDNKQIKNKREETNNNSPQQQKEQQAQQIVEHTITTTPTISNNINEVNSRINEDQKTNKAILDQIKVFNKINQNLIDNAINNIRTIHELLTEYIEIFNKSIELGQQYYRDGIKNYFNFGMKI